LALASLSGFYTLSIFYRRSAPRPTPIPGGKFNFGICSPIEVGKRLRHCSYTRSGTFLSGFSAETYLAWVTLPSAPSFTGTHCPLSPVEHKLSQREKKKRKSELQNLKA
jgi:hypothetical protein